MVAHTPTTLAVIYSHQKAVKYVDSCCVLYADVSLDCERLRLKTYMLMLNSSAFFVADMVISFGGYGLFVWPM